MIDHSERAAMEETVRAAIAGADGGAAIDAVLGKLGWLEMLAAERPDAIDIVFSALGGVDHSALPSSSSRRAMMSRCTSSVPP